MIRKSKFWLVVASAFLVGVLYILPPALLWRHFNSIGEPFILAQL